MLRLGLAGLWRWRHRRDTLLLAYHNVVPDELAGAGESSLHLPLSAFAEQVNALCRTHRIIALPDLFSSHRRGRPAAVITFDDAYRGAVMHALPLLEARGIPATMFVSPGRVGGQSFWWDRLAATSNGADWDALRHHALWTLHGAEESVSRWASERGVPAAALHPLYLSASEDEILQWAGSAVITFGSHAWSHRNLAVLTEAEVDDELARSRCWLAERFPNFVPWVAYPFGIATPPVERRAAASGYQGGCHISGGWVEARRTMPFHVPRLNVPAGLSASRFVAVAAGLA